MNLVPPSMTGCVVGDVDYVTGDVYDAREHSLYDTAVLHHQSTGDVLGRTFVIRREHGRWMTRQEQWEIHGAWMWENDGHYHGTEPDAPTNPPSGWIPEDEDICPAWTPCRPDHPHAVVLYVCESPDADSETFGGAA